MTPPEIKADAEYSLAILNEKRERLIKARTNARNEGNTDLADMFTADLARMRRTAAKIKAEAGL